jgi:predicted outer membrane protein
MSTQPTHASATRTVTRSDVDEAVRAWPARPRLAVQQMMSQYGPPLEVSSEAVIWHNAGPYKRVMVTKKEVPHDFPKPHMDFLEHTISYRVPADKVDDLVAFDASMTINATAGEMSARCDLEGHNILTLNLARDIIEGKKSVKQARAAFAEHVLEDVAGAHPAYVEALQFAPQLDGAPFPDQPNIPGSPVRGTDDPAAGGTDAEVLAFLIAMDDNVVLAATAAHKKKLGGDVATLAQRLHEAHGKAQAATMALGKAMKTTPVDTRAVDDLRVRGAGELASLVPLSGAEFERAFVGAMVKSHAEALQMIDGQLLPLAQHKKLTKHLTAVRKDVAEHLEQLRSTQ